MNTQPILSLVATLMLATATLADSNTVKTESNKAGDQTIRYRITKVENDEGKTRSLIEYEVKSTVNTSIETIQHTMENYDEHKRFTGDKLSSLIEYNPDGDPVLYYFSEAPWPVGDSEVVATMTHMTAESANGQPSWIYQVKATPDAMDASDIARFKDYEMVYFFTETANGAFDVSMRARFVPPFAIPNWMMKASFPGAAFDQMDNLITAIETP